MGGSIKSFRDLEVWEKSIDLVEEVYRVTRAFPEDERFALTNQIRRACVSLPANIAEGHQRSGTKQFLYQLSVARGSLGELEPLLVVSTRLEYVRPEDLELVWSLARDVGRLMNGLISALERKSEKEGSVVSR